MQQKILLLLLVFKFGLLSAQYDSIDLSVYISDYDFVNFSNNYTDDRMKRFLRGDGLSALNRGAHPFYNIRDQRIVKRNSYYDVEITYKGRFSDFTDIYRIHLDSYGDEIISLDVIKDGHTFTPAFSLVEKAIKLLDNDKKSSILKKLGTTKNFKMVVVYILNNKFKKY